MGAGAVTSSLNSPLEAGVRVLMVLSESLPRDVGLNDLVLFDHCVLHSGDVGGPPSLHPPIPIRAGELGMKREILQKGLNAMVRAQLVDLVATGDGIRFLASDSAPSFIGILETTYALRLHERASWVVETFGTLDDVELRSVMQRISGHWAAEFEIAEAATSDPRN
ncbi:MAG: ABC-three component system middle component 2 [Microthrixaceae bacterium]